MSAAMAIIAESAAEQGVREVLTFISNDNAASLKGAKRAGFRPVMLHRSLRKGFGLLRTDKFEKLPVSTR
jgi:L-amino acid N-acyltransferase YncA